MAETDNSAKTDNSNVIRNPYTGIEVPKVNVGNGEKIAVESLINREAPEWKQYEPTDTLTRADSTFTNLYDNLSKEPIKPVEEEKVKIEDVISKYKPNSAGNAVSVDNDQLISELINTLGI